MKNRLILTFAAAALFCPSVYAGLGPNTVPDSGSTLGLVSLALLALVAIRRKFRK